MSQSKIQDLRNTFVQQAKSPKPVSGLAIAKADHVFYFDPTITLSQDIKDHQGNIIAKKGTKINPLETADLVHDMFFFDGEDEEQLAVAKQYKEQTLWVIVSGSALNLEAREGRPVYFDQHGLLTKKLHIKKIPSRVSQEGDRLKIEEIPLERKNA